MIELTIELNSYIGHPYWPERERLINITKESGMSRARSSANRRKALEEYLGSVGMSYADFEALSAAADRPFYTDDTGHIVIPKKQVDGMLVATCATARAAMRPCPPEMVRTVLRASQWRTDLTVTDADTWERYAVVTSGAAGKLSNQRALRSNRYIGANPPGDCPPTKPVLATGTIDVNREMVRPDVLHNALRWAGEWVGIGASRKMGWGRFTVTGFDLPAELEGHQ